MKNRKLYAKINIDERGKKKVYLGKEWGTLKKKQSNTECMKTGDGIWVLDIDTKEGNKLPQALRNVLPKKPSVETANGYHYYFTGEGIPQTQALIKYVDVRNEGGLVFTKYSGDDERVSYEKIGDAVKPSKKLMKYLTSKVGEHAKRDAKTMKLSYVEGKKWKKFKDGEQHTMLMATMVKMFNERKSDAEVWSRAEQYIKNHLTDNKHERMLMKGRFDWAKKQIGDTKITGVKLKVKKPKKKVKVSKKLPPWERYILKGGEFDEESVKRLEELSYLSFIPRGHHTFIYGEAGTLKTTIISYEMIDELKKDANLKVFLYSFDASQHHNKAMWEYAKEQGVQKQFHILDEVSKDEMFKFITKANEESWDLSNAVILIDTYKKIAGNVNDKSVNVTVMDVLKSLTRLGCTVVSIGHTNKDGVNNSGTSEITQDTDGMLRFDATETGDGKIVSVTADTRLRFEFEPRSYKIDKSSGQGYNGIMDNISSLDKFVDTTTLKKDTSRIDKDEAKYGEDIEKIREAIREGFVTPYNISEATRIEERTLRRRLEKFDGIHWKHSVNEDDDKKTTKYKVIKVLG